MTEFELRGDGSGRLGQISWDGRAHGWSKDSDWRNSFERVKEFHEVFGAPVSDEANLIPEGRAVLRLELIREELEELKYAVENGDLVGIADALGDLEYVVNGAALEYGINLPEVVREIHRSNMTKLQNGEPIFREDGKILKGDDYEPPDLQGVLFD